MSNSLTQRERDVVQLVAEGLTNRQIGRRLFLSEETIKTHLRHLLAKSGKTTRAGLVGWAFRTGHVR